MMSRRRFLIGGAAIATALGGAGSAWLLDRFMEVTHPRFPTIAQHPTYANVQDYGAKGDSITNDTVAVETALRASANAGGGVVYFPPGTYIVTGRLGRSFASNMSIRGSGKGITTIKLADDSNADVFFDSVGGHTNLLFEDFTIDGNKAHQTASSRGLVLTMASRSALRNIQVQNTQGRGIYLHRCKDCLLEGCEVDSTGTAETYDTTGSGIFLLTCSSVQILGCRASNCKDVGIALGNGGTSDIVVANCTVNGGTFIGIGLGSRNQQIAVTGNSVVGSGGNGIDTGSCLDVSVSGNVVGSCSSGIVCDTGQRQNVHGNTIRNSANNGVWLGSPTELKDCVVSDNLITDSGRQGLVIVGPPGTVNTVVSSNLVKNSAKSFPNQEDGLLLEGAQGVLLIGNKCFDDQVTKTQRFGIAIDASSTGAIVIGNDVRNNATGGLNDATGTAVRSANQGDR